MRNYILIITLLIISIATQAQETEMSISEIKTFRAQISKVSKSTTTITSDFIQYKHLDFLTSDIETSGIMAFKAPNWVKWEYTNPYEYSVIFKDDQLLINDGGTKSNIKMGSSKLFKKLNKLIINSVTGDMFDDDTFKVSYYTTSEYNKVIFVSTDKKLAKMIAVFELHFNKRNGAVVEVKMIEPSQDFTRIVFLNRVLNNKISDEVFTN